MSPRARQACVLAAATALVVWGVVLSGTQGNPWNLFVVWLFPALTIEMVARKPRSWLVLAAALVVITASIDGFVETVGADQVTSTGGMLICLGVVAGVMASAKVGPLRGAPSRP